MDKLLLKNFDDYRNWKRELRKNTNSFSEKQSIDLIKFPDIFPCVVVWKWRIWMKAQQEIFELNYVYVTEKDFN